MFAIASCRRQLLTRYAVRVLAWLQLVQQREDRKRNAARALLAGKSFVDGEDEFDGLTPQVVDVKQVQTDIFPSNCVGKFWNAGTGKHGNALC